jgi:hypothetical protein
MRAVLPASILRPRDPLYRAAYTPHPFGSFLAFDLRGVRATGGDPEVRHSKTLNQTLQHESRDRCEGEL